MSVKEKILRIMALALEINQPDIPNIGEKKTAVFVDWSPHCNLLISRLLMRRERFNILKRFRV